MSCSIHGKLYPANTWSPQVPVTVTQAQRQLQPSLYVKKIFFLGIAGWVDGMPSYIHVTLLHQVCGRQLAALWVTKKPSKTTPTLENWKKVVVSHITPTNSRKQMDSSRSGQRRKRTGM